MKRLIATGKVTKDARQCAYCGSYDRVSYCFYEGRDLCQKCAAIWDEIKDGVKHDKQQ